MSAAGLSFGKTGSGRRGQSQIADRMVEVSAEHVTPESDANTVVSVEAPRPVAIAPADVNATRISDRVCRRRNLRLCTVPALSSRPFSVD